MNSAAKLTLTFLERAPKAAANVLQGLPVEQAAAYLETVPARLAGPVLNEMSPWNAARLLELVPAARAALVVRQLAYADATSLVRSMRSEARQRVFEELPSAHARRLSRSLEYPAHQVGAWIDPSVPVLAARDLVSDALRALRGAEPASHVFLESDGHGEYVGAIAIQGLLRSEPTLSLAELKPVPIKPVSNRASLASIAFDARWDELLHLPVVGRRGNLLGGLSRRTLREGLHEQNLARRAPDGSLLRDLLGALVSTCAGVSGAMLDSVGPRASEQPKEQGR